MDKQSKENAFARAIDFWGATRSEHFIWLVVLVTLSLVLLEAKYNVDLLGSLSNKSTTGAQADDLSQRGKLLAAFGISWAIGRSLLSRIKPALFGLIVFFMLSTSFYYALDYTYTKVVAELDPEIKVKGFNLYSYRHDLLTGTLIDPDIPLPGNEPVLGKIFMGAFPLVLLDERFMLPAQDIVERKAQDKSRNVLQNAELRWPEYEAMMQKLTGARADYLDTSRKALGVSTSEKEWSSYNGKMQELLQAHAQFVDGSRKALGLASDESEWSKYNTKMQDIQTSYAKFINGSKRVANHGNRGIQKFREESGGLEPNSSYSQIQFVNYVKSTNHPKGVELRNAEGQVISKRPDGKVIYGRDVPYFMSRTEFMQWTAGQAREAMKSGGMEPNANIGRLDFIVMLRTAKNKKGEEFRNSEMKQVGTKPDGAPLLAKEIPYFMSRSSFNEWSQQLAKEALAINGMEARSTISDAEFINLLRASRHPKSEGLRKSEMQEVGKRPDGKIVFAKDIPYFMSHEKYKDWFTSQAEDAKNMLLPTTQSVEKFDRIKEVNAAVFLPPMAIISSLTSALTNGIALVIILSAILLSQFTATAEYGARIKRYSIPLMLVIFSGLLFSMPSHVFSKGSAIHELETKLHEQVGLAGKIWSKLSNLEKIIL